MKNGTQVKNLKGDLMYITPGEYGGMFLRGNGNFRSEERGGIEQYDFNISFNINDRVYLGVTVGAYAIDYNKYTFIVKIIWIMPEIASGRIITCRAGTRYTVRVLM